MLGAITGAGRLLGAALLVMLFAAQWANAQTDLTLSIEGPAGPVDEGEVATFTVTLSGSPGEEVVVGYIASTASGDSASIVDFATGSGNLTFAAGASGGDLMQEITVMVRDDTLSEADETFTVRLRTTPANPLPTGVILDPAATSAQATITDQSDPIMVTIAAPDAEVAEGENAVFTVTLSGSPGTRVVLNYEATVSAGSGDTASADDFTATSGTLTFLAGAPARNWVQTVEVPVRDDNAVEGSETFSVLFRSAAGSSGFTISGDNDPQATIAASDALTISIQGPDEAVQEGEDAVFIVSVSRLPENNLSVQYGTSLTTGNDAAQQTDFTETRNQLMFSRQAGSPLTQEIRIPVTQDTLVEGNETFAVTLSEPLGIPFPAGVVLGTATAQATIAATNPPILSLSIEGPANDVSEGQLAEFTVTLSGSPEVPVVVNYAATAEAGDTATVGGALTDITANSGTLRFAAFASGDDLTQTVRVLVTDDALIEGDETFTVTLSEDTVDNPFPIGVSLDSTATSARTTIAASDPVLISITGPDAPVTEGDDAIITITLSASPSEAVGFIVSASMRPGDTATAILDFSGGGIAFFAANATGAALSQEFVIGTVDDSAVEGDETFTAHGTLSSLAFPAGVAMLNPAASSVRVTIADNDQTTNPPITIAIAPPDTPVAEGDNANFRVTLSGSPDAEVTVDVISAMVGNDTATADDDFATAPVTLTFAAGASGADLTQTAAVAVQDDALPEDVETFTATLTENAASPLPASATLNPTALSARATIAASDVVTVGVSGPSAEVDEGDDAVFSVTLSGSPDAQVVVDYATAVESTGTGLADDFTATSGTLTFAANASGAALTQEIRVPTTDDTRAERAETFTLNLFPNPLNPLPTGVILDSTATSAQATIAASDGEVVLLSIQGPAASVTEGDDATFTIALSGAPGAPIALTYQTEILPTDTAVAGDFTPTTGMLTFAENASGAALSREITVPTIDDTAREGDETFTLSLTLGAFLPDGVFLENDAFTAQATIAANDQTAEISIAGPANSVAENSEAIFTVTLSSSPSEEVVVDFFTSVESDDTATAGVDFESVTSINSGINNSLVFLADVTGADLTRQIAVRVHADTDTTEGDETFSVTLVESTSHPLPASAVLGTAIAKATIAAAARPNISIQNSADRIAVIGLPIDPVRIVSSGGAVDSFSISPTIGDGLSFDTATGSISGTYTRVPSNTPATVTYTITATNSAGTDTATVTFRNTIPLAEAGPDQSGVSAGASVTLDGVGSSDPESDALTYCWTQSAGAEPEVTLTPACDLTGGTTTLNASPSAEFVMPTLTTSTDSALEFILTVADVNGNRSLGDSLRISTHDAPTADAGPDQSVAEGDTVTLDGSASRDGQNGTALEYSWRQISVAGDTPVQLREGGVIVEGTDMPTPPFTAAPTFEVPEEVLIADAELRFELVVTDSASGLVSSADRVSINVTGVVDDPPVANAGADQTDVLVGATVTLFGRGSSDEGELGYLWVPPSVGGVPIPLSDNAAANPTFVMPEGSETLTFTLFVLDSADQSDSDTVDISPVTSQARFTDTVADTVYFTGLPAETVLPEATGGDPNELDYTLARSSDLASPSTNLPAGMSYMTLIRSIVGTPTTNTATAEYSYFVVGASGRIDSLTFNITVTDSIITGMPFVGAVLTADIDIDNVLRAALPLTYQWMADGVDISGATSRTYTPTPSDAGKRISVAIDYTGSTQALVSASTEMVTAAPETISIAGPSASVDEGDPAIFTVTLSGSPGSEVVVNYAASVETGDTALANDFTATSGMLTFAASASGTDLSQTFPVPVTDDSLPEGDETFTATLSAPGGGFPSGVTLDSSATSAQATIAANDAPAVMVSIAGPSASVDEGDPATFTVTLSASPGSEVVVNYAASVETGDTALANDFTATSDTLTFAANASGGDLSQTFSVPTTDDSDTEGEETFTVTLSAPSGGFPSGVTLDSSATSTQATIAANDAPDPGPAPGPGPAPAPAAPVANAGQPQTVTEGATVTLNGSATDPDSDAADLSYAWTQTSGQEVTLSGADSPSPSFTAPTGLSADAVLGFSLTVSDGSLSASASVNVTVTNVNDAPSADAGTDQTVDEGATVTLSGSGTDPDTGDSLSYTWTQTSGQDVTLSGADSPSASFTAPTELGVDAVLGFSLTVSDGRLSASASVTVTVTAANDAPSADAGADQSVDEGAAVTLSGSGTDPDPGDTESLSYAWTQTGGPTVSLSRANSASPSFTAPNALDTDTVLTFRLTVTDPRGASGSDSVQVTVETNVAARQQALELNLAAFGRSVAASAVDAIGERLKPASAGPQTSTVSGLSLAACLSSITNLISADTVTANSDSTADSADSTTTADSTVSTNTASANTVRASTATVHTAGLGDLGSSGDLGSTGNLGDSMGGLNRASADRQSDNPVGNACQLPDREQLARSAFVIPLGLSQNLSQNLNENDSTAEPSAQWSLWGRGDFSHFEGSPQSDFDLDGEVVSGYLGLDYRLETGALVGVALSHSSGETDYRSGETDGELETDLSSVYPYGYWSPRDGLGLWGLLGIGQGDATLSHGATTFETDLDMRLGALGLRQALHSTGEFELALKADAFIVELESEDVPGLPEVTAQARRARLLLEASRHWQVQPEARLSTSLELGVRVDGGDAEEGEGAEVGVGLEYANGRGLSTALRAHGLLAHKESDFEAWGASLTVQLDPGVSGQGLALTLTPVWGQDSGGGAQALWESERALQDSGLAQRPTARLELNLSYGLVQSDRLTRLRPFAQLEMAGGLARKLRLGMQLERPDGLELEVFAGRNASEQRAPEHLLGLSGRLHF